MRSKTLRLLIILSAILISIIVAIQLHWLNTTYKYERKQFNISVTRVIKNIFSEFELAGSNDFTFEKNIKLPQPEFYIIPVNRTPDPDSLKSLLSKELTEFNVLTDCELLIYKPGVPSYVQALYIDVPDSYSRSNKYNRPQYVRNFDYIGLYFPHRSQYILQQMLRWIISSGILLIVLTGFSFSVFYLYRQQFLNETQRNFVNNFTHEFKTPLAVMKIAADVLKQPNISDKPAKLTNYASIVSGQVDHLQKQLDRMLLIAYTDHHKLKLEKESFDANELMQTAIDSLFPIVEQKKGLIRFETTVKDSMITADRSYTLLAFTSILENAVKYSVKPDIRVNSYICDNDFCVDVQDNGPGIDKKHHRKIFNKFYRVTEGDLHAAKGFGLGLNFVKTIIETHRGRIDVKSETGKGSTFTIKIPRA